MKHPEKLTRKQQAERDAPPQVPHPLSTADLDALSPEQLRALAGRLLAVAAHYADPGNWTEHYIGGGDPGSRREYRPPRAHTGEINPNGWDVAAQTLDEALDALTSLGLRDPGPASP